MSFQAQITNHTHVSNHLKIILEICHLDVEKGKFYLTLKK